MGRTMYSHDAASPFSLPFLLCKQGVCHTVALPFTIKKYLNCKRRIMETQKYFTMKKYNLPKILYKKPKSFKIL
jgi:hypothetical protein